MSGLFLVVLIAFGVGILIWLLVPRSSTHASDQNSAGGRPVMPRINGNGSYAIEVVGESHYQASFEALLGALAYTESEISGDAVLQLQDDNPHDSQAVAVFVEGRQVGHLSRDMARTFRQALRRDGFGQLRKVAVGCRIYGGGTEGLFSVSLDLPEA
jgi:hypothetical protein